MAFDFGNANDAQRDAITTTDGPLLIIAGPGTGKTYTLVQRIIYLIREKTVKPEVKEEYHGFKNSDIISPIYGIQKENKKSSLKRANNGIINGAY